MGEHLLCKQGVRGSNPLASTITSRCGTSLLRAGGTMAGAILLFLHIAAGSIALLAALVALVAAKGRRYHILLGRVYAIAMTVIFLTSLPLAILGASAFLLLIEVFSFHLVFAGCRFARNRRGVPELVDWCAAAIMGLTGLSMWGYGIALGRAGNGQWVTMLIFGGIAVALSLVDARYYARSAKRRTRAGVPRSSDTLPICWPVCWPEPSPLLPRWQW